MSSRVIVKVQMELTYETGEVWGDNFTLGEIRKRCKESAEIVAEKLCRQARDSSNSLRVLNIDSPILILGKEDK